MSDLFTFTVPPGGGCIDVELGALLFDGQTPDTDGVCYSWQAIDGWFDTADLVVGNAPRPVGIQETVVKLGGRSITLSGLAHMPDETTPLDALAYNAMRTVKRNCRPVFASQLLLVSEPSLTLQARVRQTGPARFTMLPADGHIAGVKFQIPLIAPDPRRYDANLTTQALTTGTNVVTNNGDEPTPVVLSLTGPATNPHFQNTDAAGNPDLIYTGTPGSGAAFEIDTDAESVTVNGVNHRSQLTTAQWWQLVPGDNHIVVNHNCSIEYRDAYS